MFIAHRGKVSKNIKENSLIAFKNAIEDSFYSGIELDVRESKDHELVVVHDFIYKNHLIKRTNIDVLKSLGLITLKEVLDLDTNKLRLIDIKDDINIDNFINLISSYNKNIYVMSYNKKILKELMNKNIKVGLLTIISDNINKYKDYDFIAILNNTINCDHINYFIKKNKEIFLYGIIDGIKNYKYENYYIIDDNKKNKLFLESNCL